MSVLRGLHACRCAGCSGRPPSIGARTTARRDTRQSGAGPPTAAAAVAAAASSATISLFCSQGSTLCGPGIRCTAAPAAASPGGDKGGMWHALLHSTHCPQTANKLFLSALAPKCRGPASYGPGSNRYRRPAAARRHGDHRQALPCSRPDRRDSKCRSWHRRRRRRLRALARSECRARHPRPQPRLGACRARLAGMPHRQAALVGPGHLPADPRERCRACHSDRCCAGPGCPPLPQPLPRAPQRPAEARPCRCGT